MLIVASALRRNKEPTADKPLFGFIFALLLVPAIIILAVAFGSGYLVRPQRKLFSWCCLDMYEAGSWLTKEITQIIQLMLSVCFVDMLNRSSS